MTYINIAVPYLFDADELWSRIFGADPEAFGSWWHGITYKEGDWDKAGLVEVVLEDPDDEHATVNKTIGINDIAAALSSPSFPQHLRQNIIDDNTDCIDADAVIQHIMYGEIIYG